MKYDDLLSDINSLNFRESRTLETPYAALRAVLELCEYSRTLSPNGMISEELIIQAIEKELKC